MTRDATDAFESQGYLSAEGLLGAECRDLVRRYCLRQIFTGAASADDSDLVLRAGVRNVYGDPLTDSLLEQLAPKIEERTGRRLTPTYSLYRLYHLGSGLKPHKDRPACEISATLCLHQDFSNREGDDPDYNWLFYADGQAFSPRPGDAVIYKGMDVLHWRDPLEGKFQLQLFLHYVDRDGAWAELCKFDGRPRLGTPPSARRAGVDREVDAKLQELAAAGS